VSSNPYAAPASPIADIAATPTTEPPFFAVSLTKLAVLSFCTLGFYEIYWFYRHWRRVKERDRESISPVWRSVFAIFFCHALFVRIRDDQVAAKLGTLSAGALTAGWIVTTLLSRLPAPYFLISLVAWVFLLPAQAAANRVNAAALPDHERNARFSLANWLVVALGGIVVVLAVIGSFMPDGQG